MNIVRQHMGCGSQFQPNSHGKNQRSFILQLGNRLKLVVLVGVLTSQLLLATARADDEPADFKVECAIAVDFTLKKVTDPNNPNGPKVLPNDVHVAIGPEGLNEPMFVEKNSIEIAGVVIPSEDGIVEQGDALTLDLPIEGPEGAKLKLKAKIKLKFNNKIEVSGYWTVNGQKSDDLPTVKFRAGKQVDDDFWLIINDADYELGVINAGILNNQPDVPFSQFEPGAHGLGTFPPVPDFTLEPFDSACTTLTCPDRQLFDIVALFGEEFTPGFFSYVEGQIVDPANPADTLANFLLKHEAPSGDIPIPTLTEWVLIVLALSVAGFFVWQLKRRRKAVISAQ